MNVLISIIIPVYNVDKYIRACFDSILKNEQQNFEALLVDDESKDASGRICDEYAAKDSRFRVWHVPHSGIGCARNLALDNATGKYCFFLDPDDVIMPYSLTVLLKTLEETDSDIVLGISQNFRTPTPVVNESSSEKQTYNGAAEIRKNVLMDKNDLKPMEQKTLPMRVNYEFFSCLYKISMIRDHQIHFLSISYGEDTYVCLKYLMCSQRATTLAVPVYFHRRNPTSTTFQYHELYLRETKEYYDYYLSLFRELAPEYLEPAIVALDGQYMRRCMSGLEREIFMSPRDRSSVAICNTIKELISDPKFRAWFSFYHILKYSHGPFQKVLYLIKLRIYVPFIFAWKIYKTSVKGRKNA